MEGLTSQIPVSKLSGAITPENAFDYAEERRRRLISSYNQVISLAGEKLQRFTGTQQADKNNPRDVAMRAALIAVASLRGRYSQLKVLNYELTSAHEAHHAQANEQTSAQVLQVTQRFIIATESLLKQIEDVNIKILSVEQAIPSPVVPEAAKSLPEEGLIPRVPGDVVRTETKTLSTTTEAAVTVPVEEAATSTEALPTSLTQLLETRLDDSVTIAEYKTSLRPQIIERLQARGVSTEVAEEALAKACDPHFTAANYKFYKSSQIDINKRILVSLQNFEKRFPVTVLVDSTPTPSEVPSVGTDMVEEPVASDEHNEETEASIATEVPSAVTIEKTIPPEAVLTKEKLASLHLDDLRSIIPQYYPELKEILYSEKLKSLKVEPDGKRFLYANSNGEINEEGFLYDENGVVTNSRVTSIDQPKEYTDACTASIKRRILAEHGELFIAEVEVAPVVDESVTAPELTEAERTQEEVRVFFDTVALYKIELEKRLRDVDAKPVTEASAADLEQVREALRICDLFEARRISQMSESDPNLNKMWLEKNKTSFQELVQFIDRKFALVETVSSTTTDVEPRVESVDMTQGWQSLVGQAASLLTQIDTLQSHLEVRLAAGDNSATQGYIEALAQVRERVNSIPVLSLQADTSDTQAFESAISTYKEAADVFEGLMATSAPVVLTPEQKVFVPPPPGVPLTPTPEQIGHEQQQAALEQVAAAKTPYLVAMIKRLEFQEMSKRGVPASVVEGMRQGFDAELDRTEMAYNRAVRVVEDMQKAPLPTDAQVASLAAGKLDSFPENGVQLASAEQNEKPKSRLRRMMGMLLLVGGVSVLSTDTTDKERQTTAVGGPSVSSPELTFPTDPRLDIDLRANTTPGFVVPIRRAPFTFGSTPIGSLPAADVIPTTDTADRAPREAYNESLVREVVQNDKAEPLFDSIAAPIAARYPSVPPTLESQFRHDIYASLQDDATIVGLTPDRDINRIVAGDTLDFNTPASLYEGQLQAATAKLEVGGVLVEANTTLISNLGVHYAEELGQLAESDRLATFAEIVDRMKADSALLKRLGVSSENVDLIFAGNDILMLEEARSVVESVIESKRSGYTNDFVAPEVIETTSLVDATASEAIAAVVSGDEVDDGPSVERGNESNQRSESASSEKLVDDSKKASGEVLRTLAEQTAIYNTYIEQELGFSPVAESSGLGSWLSFFDTNDIKREQFRALENLTLKEVRKIVLETNPAERLQDFKAIGVDPNSFDVVYQSLRDDKSLDEAQTIGDILKARAVRLATSDPGKG